MKTIFLHIGMHKTGTTSIQHQMQGYSDTNTVYANLPEPNHSIAFYTAFSGLHQDYHIWKMWNIAPDVIERKRQIYLSKIETELSKTSKNIVFSGEDILHIPKSGLEEIAKLFKSHADSISVIVYVREPVGYLKSKLQENTKNGRAFLNSTETDYRQLQNFINVFGEENLTIRSFDSPHLLNGNVVDDFCALIGIPQFQNQTPKNVGYSTDAIRCLFLLNELTTPYTESPKFLAVQQAARNEFCEVVIQNFPGKFNIPDDYVLPFVDIDGWHWVKELIGDHSLSEYDPLPRNSDGKSLKSFFYDIPDDVSDHLQNILWMRGIETDFNRDAKIMVYRLYMDCLMTAKVKNDRRRKLSLFRNFK